MAKSKNGNGSGTIAALGPHDLKPGDPCKRSRHDGMERIDAHIIPKSRGGGSDNNIHKGRCKGCEEEYHAMFGVMTPVEVIEHLVKAFWNGNDESVYDYLLKYGV